MKSLYFVFIIGGFMAGIHSLGAEPFWNNFYDMAESKEVAENTSLDSRNIDELRDAGVYFFSLANGINEIPVERSRKARETYAEMAKNYLDAAWNLDRDNPELAVWRATAVLSYGGASRSLVQKIKNANAGINYFNQIPVKARNNLDYLFMRIMSFSEIPTTFRNLSESILHDSDNFIRLLKSTSSALEYHHNQLEVVKLLKAKAIYYSKNKDEDAIRALLKDVNKENMYKVRDESTTIQEYYDFLKKKMRVK